MSSQGRPPARDPGWRRSHRPARIVTGAKDDKLTLWRDKAKARWG